MVEPWRWVLHPGERYQADAHAVGTRELLTVTDGVLRLEADGRSWDVAPGQSAQLRADRAHVYGCAGNKPTQFLIVVVDRPAGP